MPFCNHFSQILGLLKENPHNKTSTFTINDIKYGTVLRQTKGVTSGGTEITKNNVNYIIDGVEQITTETPNNKDYLVVELNKGKMEMNLYKESGTKKILASVNNDFNEYYYPCLFLVQTNVANGNNNSRARVSRLQFMRNQFYGSPKTSPEVEEDLDFIGTIPKQQTAFNFIRFQGQDLASFLGF